LLGLNFPLFSLTSESSAGEFALRQQLAVLTRRHPRPNLSPLDKLFWGLARLVRLEAGSPGGHSRDRGPLASHRLPPVLESDLQGETASRKEDAIQGGQGSDLSNGRGELELGRSSDSWRASHAGVRGLGTYYFALDETRTPRSRTRSAMAPLSSQSSRGHRRHGLFTVPTLTFGLLHGFFIISHDRRRILHFNVTRHPTSSWIVQQLREAFPYQSAPRFLILDRDAKYGLEVPEALQSMSIAAVQTSFRSPWQNGVAERWVGSCRRELLDHIIALNERHLRRLLSEFVSYYHDDRTHLGLFKETPGRRIRSAATGQVIAYPRLGGLHHRYDRAT
jgi:transposase InsO family protein